MRQGREREREKGRDTSRDLSRWRTNCSAIKEIDTFRDVFVIDVWPSVSLIAEVQIKKTLPLTSIR